MTSVPKQLAIALGLVAAVVAVATFLYFDSYPDLCHGPCRTRRSSPLTDYVDVRYFWHLAAAAPPVLALAAAWPRSEFIAAGSIAAAVFAFVLVIGHLTHVPSTSSPGEAFVPLILAVAYLILVIDLGLLALALTRARKRGRGALVRHLFPGLTVALLGGWVLGIVVWSERLTPRVVAQAEAMAAGRPYCLVSHGKPVDSVRDLSGLSMLAENLGGYWLNFHALMVIGPRASRSYATWSYRHGSFLPIGDSARVRPRLDRISHCTPVPGFAARLPLVSWRGGH